MHQTLLHRLAACAITCLVAVGAWPAPAMAFVDDFSVTGNSPNPALWTTEIGPPSFLGRTQLRDWTSGNASAAFPVAGGFAQLALNTFNPSGFSLYGTHAKTLESFTATPTTGIELAVRMQLTNVQPGQVIGMYFYGCSNGSCATRHDELDIEIVTNYLQPGVAPRVQLNRYADEPLGAGHGPVVSLPGSFDALASHDWRVRWESNQVTYSVDGTVLFTATDFIPRGAMQANIIAWAPGIDWPDAYSAALQPVGSLGNDQRFVALVDSVSVTAVPEPSSWAMMLAGLLVLGFGMRGMSPELPTQPNRRLRQG